MSASDESGSGRVPPLSPPPADNADADAIEKDIEATREELGETVDALAQKFDVKTQASNQVQASKQAATERLLQVRDSVTDDEGKPTPTVLGIAGAVVALIVAVVVVRIRRK